MGRVGVRVRVRVRVGLATLRVTLCGLLPANFLELFSTLERPH